ncbi:unnamed protein product [Penicillium salamii]|uniref:Uncharacterized protein n=1 Tax=Penicillium salamii TaxID=1612424 RepID=A0A9W4J791_9EURO|nr:unnamed protein product [Penicillium salamii]CAG7986340.1 unnamed protein product [Penicillium salamii]CAG8076996.1 unnamed protein product [Penicillium salamii]CAG8249184.1 unnamed protein product [Penicillium salamii]CAG8284683.1 unnamed protein product [Penicillium salamii]
MGCYCSCPEPRRSSSDKKPSDRRPSEKRPSDKKDDFLSEAHDVERRLESSGNIYALQQHRFNMCETDMSEFPKIPNTSYNLFDVEQELRELVQEELSIRENRISNSAAADRLQHLKSQYQFLSLKWLFYLSNFAAAQWRAFDLWRSHPQWYMHSQLVDDCVGRQGCCARGCGCCLNRSHNLDASRSLGVGHCTLECGCCARARGFEFSESQKTDLKDLYQSKWEGAPWNGAYGQDRRNFHCMKIHQVSIWGFVPGSGKNPFDMINAPPSYDQSEGKKSKDDESIEEA